MFLSLKNKSIDERMQKERKLSSKRIYDTRNALGGKDDGEGRTWNVPGIINLPRRMFRVQGTLPFDDFIPPCSNNRLES